MFIHEQWQDLRMLWTVLRVLLNGLQKEVSSSSENWLINMASWLTCMCNCAGLMHAH